MKVLCILIYKSRDSHGLVESWRDSLMIKVDRSEKILVELNRILARNFRRKGQPTPFDVRLVSYLPENGKANFDDHKEDQQWAETGTVH